MKIRKGFTIIELVVVIAIIAILAAIVLINVSGYIQKGKNVAVQANLKSLVTVAGNHYATNFSTSNFCTTISTTGIAIYKMGFNFFCWDNTSGSAVVTYGGSAGTFQTTTSNCAKGEWVADAEHPTLGINYCVDSTGFNGLGGISRTTFCNCVP